MEQGQKIRKLVERYTPKC